MTDAQQKQSIDDRAVIAANLAKVMRADADLQEAKNDHQSVIKHAEGKGIHLGAAKRALKIKRSGKVEKVIEELSALFLYLRILNLPIEKKQLEMFDAFDEATPIKEKAYEQGLYAGRMGLGEGENPYSATSHQGQSFIKGLNVGSNERRIVLEMEAESELIREDDGSDADNPEDFPEEVPAEAAE